ncbi:C40 family peptidase [Tenuibacillus multivorans]|uniref:NlpC/P60 family protein n=1 Tax=Tenuibacillus multivorans TaxID=237069 RepID=A0A1G9W3M6_9BACI|nr:C40 family peptidase [Tenuibacillus multivorans]GEL78757.1 gamma-D-glutamyl-L-lysine endopeptidase [Tenuibacillus multivorans]SDM79172.1 NlpC/P60 family protein [Tenuibacillus multivorans]
MNESNHMWICNVAVSTIWTEPNSPREIDEPGLHEPANIHQWYNALTTDKRRDLCDLNLVQSQLLYGEEVIVDEIEGDWAKIIAINQPSKKDARGYPGWVPLKQLKQVEREAWSYFPIALITSKTAALMDHHNETILDLSFLTYLPVVDQHEQMVKALTPEGEAWLNRHDVAIFPSYDDIPKQTGQAIVESGHEFLELPYFWGGMSAFGYDCSGFTYNMHKANGYQIPRDASDQAKAGEHVPLNHLEIGDLLFFAFENGHIHHVGLYAGNEYMIHSPSTGKGIEMIHVPGTKYEKELCVARRYHT